MITALFQGEGASQTGPWRKRGAGNIRFFPGRNPTAQALNPSARRAWFRAGLNDPCTRPESFQPLVPGDSRAYTWGQLNKKPSRLRGATFRSSSFYHHLFLDSQVARPGVNRFPTPVRMNKNLHEDRPAAQGILERQLEPEGSVPGSKQETSRVVDGGSIHVGQPVTRSAPRLALLLFIGVLVLSAINFSAESEPHAPSGHPR